MMESYGAVFASSLALSLLLTPLALRVARRHRLLDHPGLHKQQPLAVPYLGGLAIVAAFAAAVLIAGVIGPRHLLPQLAAIIGCAVTLAVMGLVDDLRSEGLRPWLRLALQIAAACVMWTSAVQIALFEDPVVNCTLTILWIVGITNAFNLLDNMDGLSAGVAAIAAGFFFLIAALNGQYLVASLAAALAGCALGFLRSNFHPARIYMGDAGSLFLGFLLSVVAIKLVFADAARPVFFVPVLVLGVAIFDTCLVTATRLAHGRSPLQGGNDHTSHRLVFVGLPVPVAVGLLYGAGVAQGWLAIVLARTDAVTGYLLMALVVALALGLGIALGSVPVYQTSKRRRLMIREVARQSEPVGSVRLADHSPTQTVAS